MAQRTFKSERTQPVELHSFTLEGVGQLDNQEWTESFRCLHDAPASALDDLSASAGMTADGELAFNQVSLLRFFRAVIHPDDEERFNKLMHDKNRTVTIEELGDVMFWLAEVYTGRPSAPSSSSAGGAGNDGASSTASAPAST